jgi:hypothetical protein
MQAYPVMPACYAMDGLSRPHALYNYSTLQLQSRKLLYNPLRPSNHNQGGFCQSTPSPQANQGKRIETGCQFLQNQKLSLAE